MHAASHISTTMRNLKLKLHVFVQLQLSPKDAYGEKACIADRMLGRKPSKEAGAPDWLPLIDGMICAYNY